MTDNPYIKRLLGEAAQADAATELDAPPEALPPRDEAPLPPEDETLPEEPEEVEPDLSAPNVQELIQQWQRGERMGVAARLMFTQASYADFVDLAFALGHSAARELGQLLDELADTEGIEPPRTPPQYSDLLGRAAGAHEEEGVL